MLLSNRVAIVTGGARGIGRGIVLKFAEEGCSTVIADVREQEGKKTAEEVLEKGRDAFFARCDVSESRQVQAMVDQAISTFGKVDILVNNAGINLMPKSIAEFPEEDWDRVLAINLKGVFLCCKAVVPHMKEKGYGKIINISSTAAIAPTMSQSAYSASKAGVLGLTLDVALELAPSQICVNAILPGVIRTDIFEPVWPTLPPGVTKDDFFAEVTKQATPMQRIGTPQDIGNAALFLASDLSGYVTGERIIVGGGHPMKNIVLDFSAAANVKASDGS